MEAEKIICCDGTRNNDALAWAAMANRDNDMNNWMNNPFAYIMFMAMFGNGFGWGNRGNQVQDAEIQSKLNQLSTQLQDGNNDVGQIRGVQLLLCGHMLGAERWRYIGSRL